MSFTETPTFVAVFTCSGCEAEQRVRVVCDTLSGVETFVGLVVGTCPPYPSIEGLPAPRDMPEATIGKCARCGEKISGVVLDEDDGGPCHLTIDKRLRREPGVPSVVDPDAPTPIVDPTNKRN